MNGRKGSLMMLMRWNWILMVKYWKAGLYPKMVTNLRKTWWWTTYVKPVSPPAAASCRNCFPTKLTDGSEGCPQPKCTANGTGGHTHKRRKWPCHFMALGSMKSPPTHEPASLSQSLSVGDWSTVQPERAKCGTHNIHIYIYTYIHIYIFTPLRVGWPPTPQVYFGPWEWLSAPWRLPKLGNFHFSPPCGLPKLGNFHFFPPWGLPKLGNFHFSPPWGLPKLWNFHFSLPWRLRNFK